MSLLEWSKRRSADRTLPIIPNEMYLHIFEHIAPPTTRRRLTQDELRMFSNLSRVCKFFANFCLPRIFEVLEFRIPSFGSDTPKSAVCYSFDEMSRESTLCTQIAAKQPLAFSVAKTVRDCHFVAWDPDRGSWALQLMLYMKNIRKLKFTKSHVNTEHWNAIATLGSLEELIFTGCAFLHDPADAEPEKMVKVKVSALCIVMCDGLRQPVAAIDPRDLRTLSLDYMFLREVDWLPHTALRKLCIFLCDEPFGVTHIEQLHAILLQAPKSLKALALTVHDPHVPVQDAVRNILGDPAWRDLPLLRSFTLVTTLEATADVISAALDGIGGLTELESLTLRDNLITPEISPTQIRHILRDTLVPTSRLKRVNIYGKILRLVDGEWSEVSAGTT